MGSEKEKQKGKEVEKEKEEIGVSHLLPPCVLPSALTNLSPTLP